LIPQEIPNVLGNEKFHCLVHRSSQLETFANIGYYAMNVGILSQTFRDLLLFTVSRVIPVTFLIRN